MKIHSIPAITQATSGMNCFGFIVGPWV